MNQIAVNAEILDRTNGQPNGQECKQTSDCNNKRLNHELEQSTYGASCDLSTETDLAQKGTVFKGQTSSCSGKIWKTEANTNKLAMMLDPTSVDCALDGEKIELGTSTVDATECTPARSYCPYGDESFQVPNEFITIGHHSISLDKTVDGNSPPTALLKQWATTGGKPSLSSFSFLEYKQPSLYRSF